MFLVIFRNRKRTDMDAAAYDADADAMARMAARQPGYRAFKSYKALYPALKSTMHALADSRAHADAAR